MSCLVCKKNIELIQERVLLQTLPSNAYNTEKTVEHALQYDEEFARSGIGRDRYCIKIPATGPALNAAKILSDQGIATLGTAVSGLPQAIACSQAGCMYVGPYFNEVRAHGDRSLWKDGDGASHAGPRAQHPRDVPAPVQRDGQRAATVEECQLAKLPYDGTKQLGTAVPKPSHVYKFPNPTPERLKKLAATDPLAAAGYDGRLANTDIDYLAHGGEKLDEAIAADPVATARLEDALELFTTAEERSKAKMEEAMKLV
ncbi:Transaldolase [Tolypocladium capitatum]|uniref:Transaldolase n=1 Tax=Tolypocladium capitatum TaxID=45235 RepID=A0A2K3QN96_9HYPO|nr:Transaldolase [Tolypocladium capitatum]